MSRGTFEKIMRARFGKIPASKTKMDNRHYSEFKGIIKAREGGLAMVRNEIRRILGGMEVDLSFGRVKDRFDVGPWIEIMGG